MGMVNMKLEVFELAEKKTDYQGEKRLMTFENEKGNNRTRAARIEGNRSTA